MKKLTLLVGALLVAGSVQAVHEATGQIPQKTVKVDFKLKPLGGDFYELMYFNKQTKFWKSGGEVRVVEHLHDKFTVLQENRPIFSEINLTKDHHTGEFHGHIERPLRQARFGGARF